MHGFSHTTHSVSHTHLQLASTNVTLNAYGPTCWLVCRSAVSGANFITVVSQQHR